MKIITFSTTRNCLELNYYKGSKRKPELVKEFHDYREITNSETIMKTLAMLLDKKKLPPPDAVIFRAPFGGDFFQNPVFVDKGKIIQLEKLIPYSPVHLPAIINLVSAFLNFYYNIPSIIIFETSCFVRLPEREKLYAIGSDLVGITALRKYGFHGLYHEAACSQARIFMAKKGNQSKSPAILSICLEPQPEIAAFNGILPLMVTSGSTPLQGLPGETGCGDLDPSIITEIIKRTGWGPEKINSVLTQKSGFRGLNNKKVKIADILTKNKFKFSKKIFLYKILQSAGIAIAVLGNIDIVVFSGKYADNYQPVKNFLTNHLFDKINTGNRLSFLALKTTLSRIMADRAIIMMLKKPKNFVE